MYNSPQPLIAFPLELFFALLTYVYSLKKREKFYLRLSITIPLSLILINLLNISFYNFFITLNIDRNNYVFLFYGIFCLLIFFLMILCAYSMCKISLKEAVFCSTCAYLTEHIVYSIRILLSATFENISTSPLTISYFLIHIIVYTFSYHFFAKKMIRKGHYITTVYQSISLSLITLFMVLVMSLVAAVSDFLVFHSIYALFSCFFVLYSQVFQVKQVNLQKDLTINQQLWLKYRKQYTMSKENIDIINRKCHDLKHQVTALKNIKDMDERNQAISNIEDDIYIYNSFVKTGNDILDIILTEKNLLANEKNINLNCIIEGTLLNFMDTIDLYTLFGNLIDNAIDGILTINNFERKSISIYVIKKANLCIIQIENPYNGILTFSEGIPFNKSKDKNYHGYGLKSIKYISEKYDGVVDIQTENKVFLVRITFPLS